LKDIYYLFIKHDTLPDILNYQPDYNYILFLINIYRFNRVFFLKFFKFRFNFKLYFFEFRSIKINIRLTLYLIKPSSEKIKSIQKWKEETSI
jgi:hypothetical protein